ncbi:MAG: hypothetical protein ACRD1C_13020 [Terriglobales bacterium]
MRRRGWLIAIVLAVGAGVVAALWWMLPPAIVRELPDGQALVYVRLGPLRGLMPAPEPRQVAPGYAEFMRNSGFDFARDLDALAISMRGNPLRPDEATAILEGRFTPAFASWLRQHALRSERLGGGEAYVFNGWERPRQLLTVAQLNPHTLLVTNATDAVAVVAHARRWWTAAPALWRAGNNWRLLAGYGDVNALPLEAERVLDGSRPPWQGLQSFAVRAGADGSGAALRATAEAVTPEAASAARSWLQDEVQTLRPLLSEDPGQPTLRALMDRLQTGQDGRRVWARVKVDRATLAQWSQAIAER